MRLLVTGRGTSGSFQIRGEQLGNAIGARVERDAKNIDCDAAILVKRANNDLMERLQGVPVIYDIVDAWPQPAGNDWNEADSRAWLEHRVKTVKPAAIVAATEAMAEDCRRFGLPVLALPHHARPGQALNPIRDTVTRVGYEGGAQHLGWWAPFMREECARRGWEFVLNPDSLAELDIVIAVRGLKGYAPTRYKSNVKLANAQATGTPCIVAKESGYLETATGGELFAADKNSMREALDKLTDWETRLACSNLLQTRDNSLKTLAARYSEWLQALKF